jgi:UDP-glucose 4-epimerase
VAGQRQSEKGGFVLPRFIRQALSGEPLTVFGDGSQVRAFTHVKDIVDGLIRVMHYGQHPVYNLGNPANRISILELAKLVIEATASQSSIEHVDPRSIYGDLYAEAADKYPDSDLAVSELDWQPLYSVEQIIQDALEEQRTWLLTPTS